MVRKNGSKNLFIKQGDNNNLDLFMQAPEFIKDFTNWEAKNSSLEVTRSRAFEKTPFDFDADQMTDYTNIEIGNNVALCADENYSSMTIGDVHCAGQRTGYYMKETISGFPDNDHYTNDFMLSKETISGGVIPIPTVAGNSQAHFEACRSDSNKRKLAWCVPPTATEAGFSKPQIRATRDSGVFPVSLSADDFLTVWLKSLDKPNTEFTFGDLDITVGDYERPEYRTGLTYKYYSCIEEQSLTMPGSDTEFSALADGLAFTNNGYVHYLDLAKMASGINVVSKDLAFFRIPGGREGSGGEAIGEFSFTREGSYEIQGLGRIKNPIYKVEFFEFTPNFFLMDLITNQECGRVDIFNRRTGTLTVDASTNKVTFVGLTAAETLQDGDVIKIVSGLNESTGSSTINSVNGVFHLGPDRKLYTSADFSEEVDLHNIRGTAKWTLMDSANSENPTSRWRYVKSILGTNTPGVYQTFDDDVTYGGTGSNVVALTSVSELIGSSGSSFASNNDELKVRDQKFNLGRAIAIRKSDDAIAISQPANHFNTSSLCNTKYDNSNLGYGYSGNVFPFFFIDKDHKLNVDNYGKFNQGLGVLETPRETDKIAFGFTGDVRQPTSVERSEFFTNEFELKPLRISQTYTDLCENLEPAITAAADDPTGIIYGEDGDFSTPMSEPVVSTDGDNVDFYNYGDPNTGTSGGDTYSSEESEMFSDPDETFSGTSAAQTAESNDHTTKAVSVFDFSVATVNYGCVFFGYSDQDLVAIDASSGNTLIAPPNSRSNVGGVFDAATRVSVGGPINAFTNTVNGSVDQLHWRKAWALGKRQLDTVTNPTGDGFVWTIDRDEDNIADQLSTSTAPIFFEISGGTDGRYRYDAYDMRKFRDNTVDSNLWFQHPETMSGYRPAYATYWGKYDKCTDGFGQAVSFGSNGEIFIADSTSHYSGPASVLTDMLVYEYRHSEPRRDTQPQYPYYNAGDYLPQNEAISTRQQANKPLQDFADAHSRTMQDVTATNQYSYRSVYSVHIKLISDQDELLSTSRSTPVSQTGDGLYVNTQILPYSAGDISMSRYRETSSPSSISYTSKMIGGRIRKPDFSGESIVYNDLIYRYGLPDSFPFYRLSPYAPNIILHYDTDKLYVSDVSGLASEFEAEVGQLGVFKDYNYNIKIFDFSEGKTNYWLGGSNASTELSQVSTDNTTTNRLTRPALRDSTSDQLLADIVQDSRCMIWPDAQVANLSVGHVSKTGLAGRDFSGDTNATDAMFFGIGNPKTFSGKFRVSPLTASFANGEVWPRAGFSTSSSPVSVGNSQDTWTYLIVVKPNKTIFEPFPYNLLIPVSDDEIELNGFTRLRKNELAANRSILFDDKEFRYCNVSSPYYITDAWCTDHAQNADKIRYNSSVFPRLTKIPVGKNRDFRVNRGTLVFLQENSTDEFGLTIPESRQLVVYDTSTKNPKLIQKTTATLPEDVVDGDKVRARISLDDSTTSSDVLADFISVDICNGKIFTSIQPSYDFTVSGYDQQWPSDPPQILQNGDPAPCFIPAFAIFSDTGLPQLSRSEVLTEFSEPAFPFLTFVEDFSDANPYNLNNIYQYLRNEGTFTNSQVFDINNSHRSPLAFYSMKNFSKDGKAILVPVGITITVEVDTNFTSPNENVVLPIVGFYGSDPRLDIEQVGRVVDDKLLFGDDIESGAVGVSLYRYGVQNAKDMIVRRPTYRFSGGTYKGTIDIDFTSEHLLSLFEYKELSAEDNKTFRYNDGDGNAYSNQLNDYGVRIPNTYTLEFDDASKESFNRGFLRGNKCIGLGLLSWEDAGLESFRNPSVLTRNANRYSPYNNYKINEEEPHSFVNSAKMSVIVKYKEYDIGAIRRFSCGGDFHLLEDPRVNYESSPFPLPTDLLVSNTNPYTDTGGIRDIPDTPYTIRVAKSDAQPYLNQSSAVLAGTDSHSIQVVAPQISFDNPNPDFLSLAIRNIPTEDNNADLSTTGHINSSGNMDLRISGIVTEQGAMTIHLGEVLKNAAMDINMPNVIGFECDGVALSLLPPTGTQVEKTTSLVFPGGTGVSDGLSLSVNPTYTSGAFDFYVQGGLASGNMDIAMSGVHGIINTMPCVEGDLFLRGMTGPSSGIMPLHINRSSHSGDMTLVMEPGNSSGIMPLAIGAEPMSASGVLFTEGYEDVNRATTLYIGRQFEERRADLLISGPIPFEGDPITLHASGAAVTSVGSNDFNFDYMCNLTRTEDRFDFSQNSEMVIPETKSNSISRNTHLPESSFRYGYYSPLSPGKRLNNFTQSSAKIFYDQELSREAIASNRDLLVVGSNPSVLSNNIQSLQIFEYIDEDSLKLKFTYDDFFRDLVRLSGISGGDGQIFIRHKSIDVSDDNRIAVSVRISNKSGLRDAVCVLQPGKFTLRSFGQPTYDLCAIEPSYSIPISIEEVDGWVMTQAIVGDVIDDSSDLVKCDNYIGNTVQWKNKDLYYDKQSKNYGSVYYLQYSDNYSTENLAFSFNSTDDGQVYYSNRYNIPEGTKVGFGSRFKIDGDYAVVSAPLFDSFIANNDLSVMHAPSPEGAVYVYRFDSGWNFVDAIYSGGYTSSDISGVSDCTYNHALFGYSVDVNKDSGFVAVSEPVTNKIYKYVIHANDTVSLVRDYTDSTSAGFGNKINICANSILTSNAQAIKEPVFGHDFQFTPEESVAETNQYNPFTSVTKSVSSTFTFVLDIEPKGAKRLLVGRSFNVNFAGEPTINIEKLSILNRGNYGNLFIQGPITSNSNKDIIYYRPLDIETNTMGLQFASIGVNSGIPLHVHVPDPASGVIPLHLRQAERADTTLFISHVFTPASGVTSLSTLGPLTSASSGDLFSHGAAAENNNVETFILGGRTGDGGMAQAAFNLRVAQADPIASSGDFDLSLHGVVNTASGHFVANTAFVEGGLYAPAEGIMDVLHIQTDLKASATGVADLAIAVDPAAGPFDGGFPVSVGGSGVSSSIGASRENANVNLVIAATAPNSGVTTLVVNRKGIGGGEELAADANLIVYNLTESANVDLAVSGANIALADMNIAISGVVGAPTGITPTYIRGYQD